MSNFELDFVEWLGGKENSEFRIQNYEFGNPVGIGDDMAMITTPSGDRQSRSAKWLMSSDMLLDGVHFDAKNQPLSMIGRKAVACCLSDCAAMAVRPQAITVSLALPKEMSLDQVKELMRGMWAMADEFETRIVGGDTTRWQSQLAGRDHPLAIDVAIFAQPYDGVEPVTRSGAKPGDVLYVTGPLGGSRLADATQQAGYASGLPGHLTFTPRVREARTLGEALGARLHAMIDISDGLSLDLWRVCRASGVGATLSESDLELAEPACGMAEPACSSVISEDARKAADADGRSALEHALNDGEDFELLLAVEGELEDVPFPVYRVGKITDGELLLKNADGHCKPLDPKGYVH